MDVITTGFGILVAVVLVVTYVIGLIFSLRTHKDIFNPVAESGHDEGLWGWTTRRSVIALALSGMAVGLMSEILVGSITEASEAIGLSPFFVGIIVVAIVGNAAEHWVAVYFAMRNKIDLSINIAIGSAAQIALFVAPVLVLLSFVMGPRPMDLQFWPGAVIMILISTLTACLVTSNGRSAWFVGALINAVYLVFAMTLYLLPAAEGQ